MEIVPGEQPGESDILITRKQDKYWRLGFSLDDSGTRSTGRYLGGITFSLDNPFSLSDLLYVSATHNFPHYGGKGSKNYTAHYSVPFGYWQFSVTASDYDYHQTVAGAVEDYQYSGESQNLGMQLSRVLHRNGTQKTVLTYDVQARRSRNYINDTEIQVQRRQTAAWRLGLQHRHYISQATLDAGVSWQRGTRWFGAQPAPEEIFGEATALSKILQMNASFNLPFTLAEQPFSYSFRYQRQLSNTPLTPQEQFAIGNRWTVRGFDGERTLNASKGSEKGNGTTHTETTVDAGNRLTIISGRDTTLTGAQAGGETVKVDAGRHLTLTSEQDSDRYDSKQQNASAGGSFTFGSMSGSASVSLSRDKMHSNYDSVQEQTGIFAGRGGFDVTTGQHTQLNGAVIASTATADKNRLDTGTLGFSDIENRADFKTEHQSAGLSTGGSVAGNFLGNMANNLLVGANHEGHADSTTQSAVSAGNITIRDTQSQKQDVADLNRDAAHANQTLSPIFDREKEQQRLQQAQLIGEIGNQVADIARTEGQIAGEKAKRDPAALNQARAELEAAGKPFTEQDVAQRAYNNGMAASGFGTGGKYQQAIQAATAAVQGLAGGNLSAALAGGAAPYLAEVVKTMTTDPVTGEVNKAANVAAHAVVNAALAVAQGNNALAGAAGAATGEVVGMIATQMYGKPVNELSETEKQTVSTLATVAAGLAGGLVGDSGASAVAGAQSGKTTVENNALSLPSGMVSYGQAVASWNQYADANNLTPEQKLAGLDKLAKGELPDGANISKVIVDGYKDGVLIAGAWYLGPAASVGKVIGGGVIAEIANGTYQWFDLSQPGNENKNWDWKSSASAGITGMLAPGRTVGQNVGIAMGSAFFTDGPNAGAIGGAAAGAWAGGLFGEYAPGIVNSVTGKEIPGFVYDYWGGVASEFSSGFIKDLNKPKGSSEDKKK
ncbi:ShlB/FhaC/HecB family hemolysin secretion/activation protein [Escherichia coli]|nr:ShlB/FhaC/HecB family hemolysin secretion/activation protein [Escherichia coli]